MAMSGIAVDNETKAIFKGMKLDKTHELLVMQILEKKRIVVDQERSKEKCTYEDFIAFLKEYPKECFFFVYDFKKDEASAAGKLLLISWVPDTAKVQDKMIYASTKNGLSNKFEGIKSVEATDFDNVEHQELVEKSK